MDKEHKKLSLVKEAVIQIGSGGSAGFVEVCIMHPLDVIKTRLQIQTKSLDKNDPKYYDGIIDCVKKMSKHEGLFALYKGIIPPILVETPKRAVKTFSLAGLGAGVTEAILVNPFEVVKVSLQANKAKMKEVPSTWSVTKQIIEKDGFGSRGLNKGVTATIGRNGVFNMVYFGFYHSVKGVLPELEIISSLMFIAVTLNFTSPTDKNPYQEFFKKVGIGFISGSLASCINIPFDVAKSRIQGPQPVPGQIKYKSTINSLGIIYKEEGYLALYKGLLPKVLRLGPGGAIMLVVYDYMHSFLIQTFE